MARKGFMVLKGADRDAMMQDAGCRMQGLVGRRGEEGKGYKGLVSEG